jgi:pimeloyl-ACP methyl ester carboxylesterase
VVALGFLAPSLAAEEWEQVLAASLGAEHSQTRQDGVKQVDTSSVKGLKALWKVLAIRDPSKVDWYVREGAAEALANASGEDADKEIDRLISKGDEDELAREAILYSIDLKVRRAAVRLNGGNDDRKIEEAKYVLSKARGVQYFALVLPAVQEIDPSKKLLKRLQTGLNDKSARVRRAAIQGLVTYPDNSSVAPLLENLKKLEKKKAQNYREWVLTRFALETLTGQYYRDNVQDWLKWWEIAKGQFSLEKRVEEEKDKPPEGKTVVVRREGVEVNINMKVAGAPDGYPLLVIPWQGYEVDYFRPYFHGVEDVCRVYYVRMPNIDDFKGLARTKESNTIQYPTELFAKGLVDVMKESQLEKFGVLAHGPESSILAMKVAAAHPGQVTHLVLINPRSAGDVYSSHIENLKREGMRTQNKEMQKAPTICSSSRTESRSTCLPTPPRMMAWTAPSTTRASVTPRSRRPASSSTTSSSRAAQGDGGPWMVGQKAVRHVQHTASTHLHGPERPLDSARRHEARGELFQTRDRGRDDGLRGAAVHLGDLQVHAQHAGLLQDRQAAEIQGQRDESERAGSERQDGSEGQRRAEVGS